MRLNRSSLADWLLMLPLVLSGAAACEPTAQQDEMVGTGLSGIDHLPDYVSVQRFAVDGHDGFQAGDGGSMASGVSLPSHWHPGTTVRVEWNVTNWRDCHGDNYERVVPVEPYDEVGTLYVHFLADGSVRVLSSNIGPLATDYPGPRDPIRQKEPWANEEWDARCTAKQKTMEAKQ